MAKETIDKVKRTIDEKHQRLKGDINNLVVTLVTKSPEDKKTYAEQCLSSARTLSLLLHSSDTPTWLKQLQGDLERFSQSSIKPEALMRTVINIDKALTDYKFDPDSSNAKGIDFEGVFQQYFEESELPTLFDEIIDILNKIRNSGEVDSKSMLSALEELIASLKTSKKGSWLSIHGSREFLSAFLKNYAHELAVDTPLFGKVYKAFRETSDKLDREFERINDETRSQYETEIKNKVERQSKSYNSDHETGYKKILNERFRIDSSLLYTIEDTSKEQPKLPKISKDEP